MKPVVIYEPPYAHRFQPITEYYPFWELRCGAFNARERFAKLLRGRKTFYLARPETAQTAAALCPQLAVITEGSLPDEAYFISSALIPSPSFNLVERAESGTNPHCKRLARGGFKELVSSGLLDGKTTEDGGECIILHEVWELIKCLPTALEWDFRFFEPSISPGTNVTGDRGRVAVSSEASVHPSTTFDTRGGPIIIDGEAEIGSCSILRGPLYIGDKTRVFGGIVDGCSIGSNCRVQGEVEESIFHECVNKAHQGFIGHSYVSPFVNFGAMTSNSDLKNTYGPVRLQTPSGAADTGLMKFGFICGPHTKFGIGSLIPTGAIIGGFSNLFAGGAFPPKYVEHFTWYDGVEVTLNRFEQAIKVAKTVTSRRGRDFSAAEIKRALSVFRKVSRLLE